LKSLDAIEELSEGAIDIDDNVIDDLVKIEKQLRDSISGEFACVSSAPVACPF
jgi:hypothetical protein